MRQPKKTRPLSQSQIRLLEKNGCTAEAWNSIRVSKDTDLSYIHHVHFSGKISIGAIDGSIKNINGLPVKTGIYHARCHNVEIGNGCSISSIAGILSNLSIGNHVVIGNCGTIACIGKSNFGNGCMIDILNEGGGRKVPITQDMNAQLAYIHTHYRHDSTLVNQLDLLSQTCAQKASSTKAAIGDHSVIINCPEIINVCIGNNAMINGVLSFKNGTIASSKQSSTTIGAGVIAEDFIIQHGANVHSGAIVRRSLIGQNVQCGCNCSLINTALFANSEILHSEINSVLAGPYTVSHHRATLLIAGQFSFFNAGSGTNQSNHAYKLGPHHQGILERGCKTASNAYCMWPSRVGAYSVVIGKHANRFDSSMFPFSYVIEENNKTIVLPAKTCFSVGLYRDERKWPERDRRTLPFNNDCIIYSAFSPYTIQKACAAIDYCKKLQKNCGPDELIACNGFFIKQRSLETIITDYQLIVDRYKGDVFFIRNAHLNDILQQNPERQKLFRQHPEWIDVLGLICSKNRFDALYSALTDNSITSIDQFINECHSIETKYRADEQNWVLSTFDVNEDGGLRAKTTKLIIKAWYTASHTILDRIIEDVRRDFAQDARIGYGIDGHDDADFATVRGTCDDNETMKMLKRDKENIETIYKSFATLLSL